MVRIEFVNVLTFDETVNGVCTDTSFLTQSLAFGQDFHAAQNHRVSNKLECRSYHHHHPINESTD